MKESAFVRLRAAVSIGDEVGDNGVRLDRRVRRHLGVAPGDVVEIYARGVTWARVRPALDADEEASGTARFDPDRLASIGGRPGGEVLVRAAQPRRAQYVVVTQAEDDDEAIPEADIHAELEGRTIVAGDVVRIDVTKEGRAGHATLSLIGLRLVSVHGEERQMSPRNLHILDTDPAGPVVVERDTEVSIRRVDDADTRRETEA